MQFDETLEDIRRMAGIEAIAADVLVEGGDAASIEATAAVGRTFEAGVAGGVGEPPVHEHPHAGQFAVDGGEPHGR